jgi:integrase
VAPLGKIVPGDNDQLAEGQINRWLREVRPLAGLTEWPNNALRHSFASHACAMHDDFAKVAAWLGHARDPRLLVTRYRHAVAKDAGKKWFDVTPDDKPTPRPAGQARVGGGGADGHRVHFPGRSRLDLPHRSVH